MRMQRLLTLVSIFALLPLVSYAQQGPRAISSGLFDAFESWSDSRATLETVALDQHPDVIRIYTETLPDIYQGLTIDQHFAGTYPEAHFAYLAALEVEQVEDPADFVAFAMSHRPKAYFEWQAEPLLAEQGLDFASFVDASYPDLAEAAQQAALSPADRGIPLEQHVASLGDEAVELELTALLTDFDGPVGTADPSSSCVCSTFVDFPSEPDPWQVEPVVSQSKKWGWPKKLRELFFYRAGHGAGKDFAFRRKSEHTVYPESTNAVSYDSRMRVRMNCFRPFYPITECSGCVGELALRADYASRTYEKVDFGGIWNKRSQMVAGDLAVLRFDPPGAPPEQTLFEKGVAVAGDTSTGWNAEAALTLLKSVANIAVIVATDGTSAATLLEGDLIDDTYHAIIGLIQREGSPGAKTLDMEVAYDTAASAPFVLLPNQTLLFELDTTSTFYSRGYGKYTEGWADIDSSHYLVAVTRNYQCSNATPPLPQSHWFWSVSNHAPRSALTLQNLVRSWISVELGANPSGTEQNKGHWP